MEYTELYKKHRPKKFAEVLGQGQKMKSLEWMAEKKKVPHCILFEGPSGCGKTTTARILANELECGEEDLHEINVADFRGIETIRKIRTEMSLHPMNGPVMVWIIDEAHQLSSQAQNAFLKMLEDTPKHVYFFLCTTNPNKLLKTIRTRAFQIKLNLLSDDDLLLLIRTICKREKKRLSKDVALKLAEVSEGSARKALVLLEQLFSIEGEEERFEFLEKSETQQQAIELVRTLMRPDCSWRDVAKILSALDDEPENVRYLVLAYANSVLLKGGKLANRAASIISAFSENFYDSKKAGLSLACWEVLFPGD